MSEHRDNLCHVGGMTINLNLIRCEWDERKVTVRENGCAPVTFEGDDREILAEAVGYPLPSELAEYKKAHCEKRKARQAKADKAVEDAKRKGEEEAEAEAKKAEAHAHKAHAK